MKLRHSSFYLSRNVLAAVSICLTSGLAHATQYTWDADGVGPVTNDGAGSWSDAKWYNGTSDVNWGNTTSDEAIIGSGNGAAGQIDISGTITANKITFNAPGSGNYTLAGGTINMGGSTPTITTAGNATIHSIISGGSGLTVKGGGTLTLESKNTYTGSTTIDGTTLKVTTGNLYGGGYIDTTITVKNGGTLELSYWNYDDPTTHQGSLGGIKYDNGIAVNNGTIRMSNSTAQSYFRQMSVGAGGMTLDANGTALWTLSVNGTRHSSFTGNAPLTLTGNGTGGGRFEQVFSGGGVLTKSGTGTWTMSASNTYTGATSVTAGSLYINGMLANTPTTVSSGATLGGNGTINGTVNVSGTLDPGSAAGTVGTMTLSKDLTLADTSTSIFNLNSSNQTTDKIFSTANILFGGTLNVTDIAGAPAFAEGQSYDLFDFASATGTFSAVNLPTLPVGLFWDQSQLYSLGVITVIPEPSVALLAGLGGLLLLRRRRS